MNINASVLRNGPKEIYQTLSQWMTGKKNIQQLSKL